MLRILPLLILLLIVDLPIWWMHLRQCHWSLQVLFFIPLIAASVLMTLVQTPLYQAWMFRWGMLIILLVFLPKLLMLLFSLPALVWKPFSWVGIGVGAASLLLMLFGCIWGYKNVVVNKQELSFNDLPKGFDGYRIVHLSDLHIGTFAGSRDVVEDIVEKVNAQNPDLIVFTGDLVNSDPTELDEFMDILPKLKAKDGIYSIMGNHDYCTYRKYNSQAEMIATVKDLQHRESIFGWTLLNNSSVLLRHNGDSIMLAGVENSSKPPFPDYADLKKALSCVECGDNDVFKVLLSHDPTHWRREVLPSSDVSLQLSGHTHATQFRAFGWSPASFVYDEWGGLYAEKGRQLYVSTGTGGNLPFRIGAWPEIVVLTLHRK